MSRQGKPNSGRPAPIASAILFAWDNLSLLVGVLISSSSAVVVACSGSTIVAGSGATPIFLSLVSAIAIGYDIYDVAGCRRFELERVFDKEVLRLRLEGSSSQGSQASGTTAEVFEKVRRRMCLWEVVRKLWRSVVVGDSSRVIPESRSGGINYVISSYF